MARSKHIRLKITGTVCSQKDSPIILDKEGFHQNDKKLDDAYHKLITDYNATSHHKLEWNRKLGKVVGRDDEGKINCTQCGRYWPWKDRANIRRTTCIPNSISSAPSHQISPTPPIIPTVRLRTKTTPTQSHQASASSHVPSESSSSTALPAPSSGHDNADVKKRRGVG